MIGAEFDAVLAAAQAGAESAIARLYRDLNPSLLRFLSAQAQGAGEDLAQEAWLAAAPQLASSAGNERALRAWLFTIARRRLIEHWRHLGRRPSTAMDTATLDALTGASRGEEPDHGVMARAAIAELIDGLSPELAEIVLLRVVAGLDADEVGAIVGKRAGTVRVLQHRALRRIGQRISLEAVTT